MKSESELIQDLKKACDKKYKAGYDIYHVYSTSYGIQGQPDLIFLEAGNQRAYFVECKKASSLEEAQVSLRSTQVGRIEQLYQVGHSCLLLYWNGCAIYKGRKQWENFTDTPDNKFSGFFLCIERLKII